MSSAVPAPAEDASPTLPWIFCGLVLPMILYAARMVGVLVQTEIPFDSLHTYLPLARQLLEEGARVFSTADSYKVAPGTVVYMALAGADPVLIKSANLAISLAALALAFDAAHRIGGRIAAVAAGWLYALPHMLVEAGGTLLGESPFIFLVAVWLWASSCAAQDWRGPRARLLQAGVVLLAGLALAAATLTRATYMYWLPFAALVFLLAAWRMHGGMRGAALRFAAIHLLATALVGTYVLRQNDVFGRPMVATGSGAALYFGSNPVLSGYEPPFFGLGHDEVTVLGQQSHLSMEGDRRLMAVARTMLQDLPTTVLLKMYVRKLGAVLFFSRAHLNPHTVMNDRAWRVALVVLSALGVWGLRRHPMGWMVGGAAAYQCAVHVPVLYNPRYSISALDILLVLLAAQGIAWILRRQRPAAATACAVVVIAGGIAIGIYHQRHSRPLLPDFSLIPAVPIARAQAGELRTEGWSGDPFQAEARMLAGSALLEWNPKKPAPQHWITYLHLGMPRFEGRCSRAWLIQSDAGGATRSVSIGLNGLREGQDINWGIAQVLLPEDHERKFQLRFECREGTLMRFDGIGLYQASPSHYYGPRAFPP
ncbi:hypothetical protein [Paracidovorax citrulli]|uniref:hypothetical protein n=1 Tax=Paracidovorax citrulli TaxID=80869 RepID=UPI0005FAE452|nr:hypothetical protein [Paracidovorax citrulli]